MRDKAKDAAEKAIRGQRAMESAFRLFSEKGIDLVTMPDISADSGVGRSSLYRYFSTKLDLVIAIGTWKWNEYIDAHYATLTPEKLNQMTAAEYLRWYMDAFIDLYRNHSDILRFNYYFNSYLRNEKAAQEQVQPYMDVIERLKAGFHEIYEKGVKDGTIRTEISEEAMISSSFHIMLAAVTRYAVGLVYAPEEGTNPEAELVMLENALLREYTIVN